MFLVLEIYLVLFRIPNPYIYLQLVVITRLKNANSIYRWKHYNYEIVCFIIETRINRKHYKNIPRLNDFTKQWILSINIIVFGNYINNVPLTFTLSLYPSASSIVIDLISYFKLVYITRAD